jgi:DNA-binding MarR family transcriptional regulator
MTTASQFAFGPTLAFAEQTLTAQLHQHLAERQTTPATWYALQLITIRGPKLARDALIQALERSRTLNPDSTRDLLARLEAEGLIRGEAELELTAKGQELHRSLREFVTGSTARLLSQFDADDIDITMRTLQAITKHVAAELATESNTPTP